MSVVVHGAFLVAEQNVLAKVFASEFVEGIACTSSTQRRREAQCGRHDVVADDIEVKKSNIEIGKILQPPKGKRYDVEVLLEANGQPFVYSLSRTQWNGGKIYIVNNASFLVNLQLVNHENRKLAEVVAYETVHREPILFIENYGRLPISNTDADNANRWSWITKAPLRYIVPHLLFWSMLFCFVYFH